MDEHLSNLIAYIQQHLHQGVPEPAIRQTLLQSGWTAEWIDQAFLHIRAQQAPQPVVQPVASPLIATSYQAANPYHQPANYQAAQPVDPTRFQQSSTRSLDVPQKYKVFRAISDALHAMRNNVVGVSVALLISLGMLTAAIAACTFIVFGSGLLAFSLSDSIGTMILTLLIMLLVIQVPYVIASTVSTTAISLALLDGMEGRKSSITQLFRTTVSRSWRVLGATTWYVSAVLWPSFVLTAVNITTMVLSGFGSGLDSFSLVLPLLNIGAIVWSIIAGINFFLAPYVAMFETHIPVRQTLARSRYLVKNGGQWFIVKSYVLLLMINMTLAALLIGSGAHLSSKQNLLFVGVAWAIAMLCTGIWVMLYYNRKQVRG